MTDRLRLQVFMGIISMIIIGLVYTNIMGNKQDEEFKSDYMVYQSALSMLQEPRPEDSISLLTPLTEKYPNQYIISRYTGLAYATSGENKVAETYYQKAIDQRPFLQLDPIFVLQYGELAYFNENYVKAKAYLELSKRFQENEQFIQSIDAKLDDIEKELNMVDSKDENV